MKSTAITSRLLVFLLLVSGSTHAANDGQVLEWVRQQEAAGLISGAAVADVQGAEMRVSGFGRRGLLDASVPDAKTQFQIGSITKVFTNLLLAEMVDSGQVTASSTLGELMPEGFAPRNPAIAAISLRALSTHASGLPRLPANLDLSNTVDPYASYDDEALLAGLSATRDRQPLGSFYTYSNFGLGTLGYLLGRANGDGYSAALLGRVIAPLGLRRTGFAPDANAASPVAGGKSVTPWKFQDALAGGGALWGSVEDLGLLVQAYLGTHEHGLSHQLEGDLRVQDLRAGTFEVTPVWHVARADGQPIYWHNGGTAGFTSFVGFRPDQQRGIAILVSGDADPTTAGLAALGHTAPDSLALPVDADVLGQYQLTDEFAIRIFEKGGQLLAQATGQPALRIHVVDDAWYAYGDVDASLRFLRTDGRVVGLELAQGGQLSRAARVAETPPTASNPAPGQTPDPKVARLEDYVGRFGFAPGIELSVRRQDGGLEAKLTGQTWLPVHGRGEDRFAYTVVDAELQFQRNAAGDVDAVALHQGGVEQRAARLP